jgi:hypothetical protein
MATAKCRAREPAPRCDPASVRYADLEARSREGPLRAAGAHDQTDRYPRTEVQEHDPWDDEEDDVIVEGGDDVVKKPAPLTNAEACRYVRGA